MMMRIYYLLMLDESKWEPESAGRIPAVTECLFMLASGVQVQTCKERSGKRSHNHRKEFIS